MCIRDRVRANGDISVKAIAAGSNIRLLEEQIREFNPAVCGVWDEERAEDLALRVRDTDTRIVSGMDGLMEIAAMDGYEILVTAVVGMIGIRPTMAAIKSGKDIALANKETLVTAGHLIVPLAREHQVRLLPVDSEHSAIFQCLNGEYRNKIDKILLTASGGPFRGWTRKQMEHVQVEDALKHPNWSMGRKITIDSSTMVNKGIAGQFLFKFFGISTNGFRIAGGVIIFKIGFDMLQARYTPVSYTHLDVYKRQLLYVPCEKYWTNKVCTLPHSCIIGGTNR